MLGDSRACWETRASYDVSHTAQLLGTGGNDVTVNHIRSNDDDCVTLIKETALITCV